MVVLFVMFALVGAFLFLATSARLINERYHENAAALYLAEAGVDYAIWEINYGGADFSGWTGNPAIEVTKAINNIQDADGNIYGNISVSVYNFGQEIVTVRSTGSFSSLTGPQVSRTVQAFLKKHHISNYAILTQQSISVGGNTTIDSYLGAFPDRSNGDLVTNSSATPAITTTGNACSISGAGITGPGGTISDQHDKIAIEDDNAEVYIPPVDNDFTGLASEGSINTSYEITGDHKYDSLTLSSTDKVTLDCASGAVNAYFTGDISLSGKAEIEVLNSDSSSDRIANVYFDGDISISANNNKVNTSTKDPSNLVFYGKNTGSQSVNLTGGEIYGIFYAPSADFSISGNPDIYGSITAKTVDVSGTAEIHFDEELKDKSPAKGYDPYCWEEK